MKRLLICFDVDGTLIDDTTFIWETLHEQIQTNPEERKFWSDAYWNDKITYAEWATKDVEMWVRKGVDRRRLLQAISHLKPMKGARETLRALKERGHLLGVISGSLDIALEQAIPEYSSLFEFIFLNRLIFDEKDLLIGVEPTAFDIEHKATGLKKMAAEMGLPLKDTVFIGDNFNDIDVAGIAGCAIAFNCKSEELADISHAVVQEKDLRAILPIIDTYAKKNQYAEKEAES